MSTKPPLQQLPPPPSPPPSYLERYKTVFGKSVAFVRHLLNRFQPWSSDHRFAIASWGLVGGTWWIIAGTSTFLSLLIWAIPSRQFQEWVAAKVSEQATRHSGAKVSFDSAIQPTWKTLRFKNVHIVRTREMAGADNVMDVDITIERLDVKVSLLWLLEGKGIVEEAEMVGIRGTLDRRHSWDQWDDLGNLIPWDKQEWASPAERWRAQWYRGSFHLAKCVVKDAVLTLLQPSPDRPIEVVVHSFQSRRLRRQWLMFDLLCSNADGSFDHRLFSCRAPPNQLSSDPNIELRQFQMDGSNVDLVRGGATGPLTWLTKGDLDLDALMFMPKVVGSNERLNETVKMQLSMRMSNLEASVPLGDASMSSYLNAALVQPIVVYINTNYISIPLDATLSIPMTYYNGAWSPWDAAMTDALSEAVGVQLSKKVADQKKPRNLVWLIIKGAEGVWRAAKHGIYIAMAYATVG